MSTEPNMWNRINALSIVLLGGLLAGCDSTQLSATAEWVAGAECQPALLVTVQSNVKARFGYTTDGRRVQVEILSESGKSHPYFEFDYDFPSESHPERLRLLVPGKDDLGKHMVLRLSEPKMKISVEVPPLPVGAENQLIGLGEFGSDETQGNPGSQESETSQSQMWTVRPFIQLTANSGSRLSLRPRIGIHSYISVEKSMMAFSFQGCGILNLQPSLGGGTIENFRRATVQVPLSYFLKLRSSEKTRGSNYKIVSGEEITVEYPDLSSFEDEFVIPLVVALRGGQQVAMSIKGKFKIDKILANWHRSMISSSETVFNILPIVAGIKTEIGDVPPADFNWLDLDKGNDSPSAIKERNKKGLLFRKVDLDGHITPLLVYRKGDGPDSLDGVRYLVVDKLTEKDMPACGPYGSEGTSYGADFINHKGIIHYLEVKNLSTKKTDFIKSYSPHPSDPTATCPYKVAATEFGFPAVDTIYSQPAELIKDIHLPLEILKRFVIMKEG
jgi:hypothetical protein